LWVREIATIQDGPGNYEPSWIQTDADTHEEVLIRIQLTIGNEAQTNEATLNKDDCD
jgi:hypothetical protein